VLVGRVDGLCRDAGGRTRGLMVWVDTGVPALIPVLGTNFPRAAKGDKVWVRGTIESHPESGQKYPLLCVVARVIDVLKPKGAS
jgi:hypothetical protein